MPPLRNFSGHPTFFINTGQEKNISDLWGYGAWEFTQACPSIFFILSGYTPYKITHASDYIPQLYQYALELIRRGHAYVCHQEPEVMRQRNAPPIPWRQRPIDESLALFEVRGDQCEMIELKPSWLILKKYPLMMYAKKCVLNHCE